MTEDKFLGIRDFITVAQSGSFSAAALALGMTGSALSKSIMRLETRLSTRLLHRTTRRISLTNEGETYLASCLRAMQVMEEAENFLTIGQQEPAGRIHINLPAAFGRRHVLPTLMALARRHERLDLSITFSERRIDLINDGVDLVVRIGELENDSGLVARKLGEQRLVICCAPSYLKKREAPRVKEDLLRHDCLIDWRRGLKHGWLLKSETGEMELFEIPVRHELGDGEAILAATLAGCGLAQLPTWLANEHLQAGELVPVLNKLSGGEMPIHAIWAKSHYIQPKLRIIIDELLLIAKAPHSGFKHQIY